MPALFYRLSDELGGVLRLDDVIYMQVPHIAEHTSPSGKGRCELYVYMRPPVSGFELLYTCKKDADAEYERVISCLEIGC